MTGLGYNIYEGQKNTANIQSLTNAANTASANLASLMNEGQALQQYLTNGTLPPQYMQTIQNAVEAAKANAISNLPRYLAIQATPPTAAKNTAAIQACESGNLFVAIATVIVSAAIPHIKAIAKRHQ